MIILPPAKQSDASLSIGEAESQVVVQFGLFSEIPSRARDPYSLRQSLGDGRFERVGMK
jgi:hypothetical protein